MIAKPRLKLVSVLASFAAALALALPALAYRYPLTATDIRNAYLLGTRKDSVTSDFVAWYRQDLPAPQTGPNVSYVLVATPYSQVVELGQSALNPDTQQAGIDLAKKEFPFIVRVGVYVTATYPASQPANTASQGELVPDFANDFKVTLSQGDKEISAGSSRVYVLYSNNNLGPRSNSISGATIELKYDNGDLDPNGRISIKVQTPDSQKIQAKFDLATLK
jgi:hypothetical protein